MDGLARFLGSFVAIGVLIIAAKVVPAGLLQALHDSTKISPLRIGVVGALFYIAVLFAEQLAIGTKLPALLGLIFVVAVQALFLLYILKVIGHSNNERQLIALAAGLVVPIATIGFIAKISFPLVLVADLAFGLFIWKLMKKYKLANGGSSTSKT